MQIKNTEQSKNQKSRSEGCEHILKGYCALVCLRPRSLTGDSFKAPHCVGVALRLFAVLLVHFEHAHGDHVPVGAVVREDALPGSAVVPSQEPGHAALQDQQQVRGGEQEEGPSRHGSRNRVIPSKWSQW